MLFFFVISFFLAKASGLKTWIPNTDISNKFNWDKEDLPKKCDKINFPDESEISTFWDMKDLVVSELSLSRTGDIIFSDNAKVYITDKQKCSDVRELNFIRNDVRSWFDPFNWKSDSEFKWLPHSERVPCTGENIHFPAQRTFAIQLPSVLVPLGEISFDNEVFQGAQWSQFLKSELGYQLFSGPDDLRNLAWHNDIGCTDETKCICSRSAYTIRNGQYKKVSPQIFEEAVCLYALPKCQPVNCFSPVIPEGHCCGICGAIIRLEDKVKSLHMGKIKLKVQQELKKFNFENFLKTYVGRTKSSTIQIVIIADNPDFTMKSHMLASIIERKFIGEKLLARISSHKSGLTFSSYLFNSISGVVFGTLFTALIFLSTVYYFYIVLPKKKFPRSNMGKSFTFARFDNTLNETESEEHLEINVESEILKGQAQAFDNPMFSGNAELSSCEAKDSNDSGSKIMRNAPNTEVTNTVDSTSFIYKSNE